MSDESKNPALIELAAMQYVGDGSQMAGQIADLVGKTVLFHDLDRNDLALLAGFMKLYKVEQGNAVLQEGAYGDIMLLLIEGKIEVFKQDIRRRQKHIATVTPGQTVGEMAAIDGQPRFATCIAAEPSTLAVLGRDDLVRLIDREPRLGAKILVQLLEMVSQRLRQTGGILVDYLKID